MNNVTSYERGYMQSVNVINATIENDNIYQVSGWPNNQRNQIGVTLKQYTELKKTCEGFYEILVEKGIIQKERTQEELLQEQIEANRKIQENLNTVLSFMQNMSQEIFDIKEKQKVSEKKEDIIIEGEIKDIVPLEKKNGFKDMFNLNKNKE